MKKAPSGAFFCGKMKQLLQKRITASVFDYLIKVNSSLNNTILCTSERGDVRMKKMMMIAGVGLMSTTLFVGCQNASPESKRIGSAAIGGGAGGAVGKHVGGNLGAGLGAAIGAGVAANAKGSNSKNTRNSAIGAGLGAVIGGAVLGGDSGAAVGGALGGSAGSAYGEKKGKY
jgi:hypothetical protein